MPNPVGEVQATYREFRVTFISIERLGVMFDSIEEGLRQGTKKARASHLKWVDHTLMRLKLIDSSPRWATYSISIGSDFSGNYGVFVCQEKVIEDAS